MICCTVRGQAFFLLTLLPYGERTMRFFYWYECLTGNAQSLPRAQHNNSLRDNPLGVKVNIFFQLGHTGKKIFMNTALAHCNLSSG
jgi:hypothetical protein